MLAITLFIYIKIKKKNHYFVFCINNILTNYNGYIYEILFTFQSSYFKNLYVTLINYFNFYIISHMDQEINQIPNNKIFENPDNVTKQ
jgi:hypothetical protein